MEEEASFLHLREGWTSLSYVCRVNIVSSRGDSVKVMSLCERILNTLSSVEGKKAMLLPDGHVNATSPCDGKVHILPHDGG